MRHRISCLSLVAALSLGFLSVPALVRQRGDEPLKAPKVVRFDANPILRPEMIPKTDGVHSSNLNFP